MDLLFYLFSSMTLISGVMVIQARNPVHSVLFLILVFFNAAGLLILLGLDFFAMIFLVVYVGAIAVLFLFVVMMLNVKIFTFDLTKFYFLCFLIFIIFFVQILSFNSNKPIYSQVHKLPKSYIFKIFNNKIKKIIY